MASSKKVIKASIYKGPSLRTLEQMVTDPCPGGRPRSTKFEFIQRGSAKNFIPIINAVLYGMTRTEKDPANPMNNFLWRITGSAGISYSLGFKDEEVRFLIKEYSPITRRGTIFLIVSKK